MEEAQHCQPCAHSPGFDLWRLPPLAWSSWVATRILLCPTDWLLREAHPNNLSEFVGHPWSAPHCWPLRACVHQSCESRLPTTPNTQFIERLRVLPCAWEFVPEPLHRAPPLRCQGLRPRSSWPCSRCLHRARARFVQTSLDAEFAMCGWLVDLNSGARCAVVPPPTVALSSD